MSTESVPIDVELLQRAKRLADERHCSVGEILAAALDHLEEARRPGGILLGLFSDDQQLVDRVLEDVWRTRETAALRQRGNG